jgi:endo-1,4-beta-xylanase
MPTLAQKFADDFRVGCVIDGDVPTKYSDAERRLVVQEYDAITIENSLKAHYVHPKPERYEFAIPDAICDLAHRHQMEVTGHCLLWHQGYPEWVFAGGEREQVWERVRGHIRTMLQHYRGRMQGWDVVNEAISDRPNEWLRPSNFTRCLGDDFVVDAFRAAHEADPNVELYYNDYNIELPEKRRRTVRLLQEIQKRGPRLDAVGIQGHWQLGRVPLAAIEEAIVEYHRMGLGVMITELDIDVLPRAKAGADVATTQAAAPRSPADSLTPPAEVLKRQADDYAALFRLFRKHRDKITRVTFWGLHDGRSWLNSWPVKGRTNHALLFDRQCRPKPAWDAVMAL